MNPRFDVTFLKSARQFLNEIPQDAKLKIIYNIDKAKIVNDPELFKKLRNDIWEFRTKYNGNQYRLLAFWDKRDKKNTVVVCCNGLIKSALKFQKTKSIQQKS